MRRYLGGMILILLAVNLLGCSTGSGSSKSRGRVSDAAAQAAEEDDDRGNGRTRTKTDHKDPQSPYYAGEEEEDDGGSFLGGFIAGLFFGGDDDEDDQTYVTIADSDSEPGPAQDQEVPTSDSEISLSRHNISAWYSLAFPAGDVFKNISTYSLMYSSYLGDRFRGHVGLYFGEGQKGSQSVVQDGIASLSEFGIDIGFREYLTPGHTLVGLYLLFGTKIGEIDWTYNQAVSSGGGTELIQQDFVFLLTPYLGVGTSLIQFKSFHVGGSVCWGMRFAADKTDEGFENDLFRDVGEFRMNIEASYFF